MKKTLAGVLLILSLGFGFASDAKVRKEVFKEGQTLTAGQLFLNQVDTVCLYLSTERVVYLPRLKNELELTVTLTLFDVAYDSQSEALRDFVMRNIKTFNKTLKERLEFYTPELAKEFDADSDVEFVVQVGADRTRVAHYAQKKWLWLGSQESVAPKPTVSRAPVVEEKPVDLTDCKRKCPALIHRKAAPEPETSTTDPSDIDQPAATDQPATEQQPAEKQDKPITGETLPL